MSGRAITVLRQRCQLEIETYFATHTALLDSIRPGFRGIWQRLPVAPAKALGALTASTAGAIGHILDQRLPDVFPLLTPQGQRRPTRGAQKPPKSDQESNAWLNERVPPPDHTFDDEHHAALGACMYGQKGDEQEV